MKKTKFNLFLCMAAVAFSACNKNDVDPVSGGEGPGSEELATFRFEMDAAALNPVLKSRAFTIGSENFRILAFRKNTDNKFVFVDDVTFTEKNYNTTTNKFVGKGQVPVGVYKFVPAYGLPSKTAAATDKNVGISALSPTTALDANVTASHKATGVLPAIFLRSADETIPENNLGLTSKENQVVTATLKRAVGRVDLLLLKAQKTAGGYTELPENVFGNYQIDTIEMSFANVNSVVKLMDGEPGATDKLIASSFKPSLSEALTTGTRNPGPSVVGVATPYDFEDIKPGDIIAGGAHVYGPFLFPFADKNTTSNLTLRLKSKKDANGHIYERSITVPNVPMGRNQVTLVKVYATGEDIFHTGVTFEVQVIKDWGEPLNASGEAM